MQQHIMATRVFADDNLEVVGNKQRVVKPGVAGSSDDEEPKWHNVPVGGIGWAEWV
jgi:hypothetical protein